MITGNDRSRRVEHGLIDSGSIGSRRADPSKGPTGETSTGNGCLRGSSCPPIQRKAVTK